MQRMLHMMVGLPRSGKSTYAMGLGYPIVSPDAIRLGLHGMSWLAKAEPMVWAIAHVMVEGLFHAGHDNVTLDACNCTPKRRQEWESELWVVRYHIIPTPKSICRSRANETGRSDLIPVIERMAAVWDPPGVGKDC